MLDPNPYNPETDPDIDMFMSHWKESTAKILHGNLLERVIFTPLEGDDPHHPKKRGAILTSIKRFAYATLDAGNVVPPTILDNSQEIYVFVSGKGTMSAGDMTVDLEEGVMVLVPQNLEFTMACTGDEQLEMYIITEPIRPGFVPNKQLLVKNENLEPLGGTSGHWAHITKAFFRKADGLSVLYGFCPAWFAPMTMGQPHSHGTFIEEIWFSLEGECSIMLGKELRAFPHGTAYKVPSTGMTPHSTINVSDKPAKVFWFMEADLNWEPPPYSRLHPRSFDPEIDHDIDLYMGSWKNSMPRKTHGSLIERDILTPGDPSKPETRSAVLRHASRFTYATLGANETTAPVILSGEQEIYYVYSGKGRISAGGKTADLKPGIAVLMPPDIEFTLENTSDKTLGMYLIAESCPGGFKPRKEMVIVDENKTSWDPENPHWTGLSKTLFTEEKGLATLTVVNTVQFDPMTIYHPHSPPKGIEEVWTGLSGEAHFLLGKQIRSQEPGTACIIPPDGETPHAPFNVSGDRMKLLRFSRFPE